MLRLLSCQKKCSCCNSSSTGLSTSCLDASLKNCQKTIPIKRSYLNLSIPDNLSRKISNIYPMPAQQKNALTMKSMTQVYGLMTLYQPRSLSLNRQSLKVMVLSTMKLSTTRRHIAWLSSQEATQYLFTSVQSAVTKMSIALTYNLHQITCQMAALLMFLSQLVSWLKNGCITYPCLVSSAPNNS